MTYDRNKMNLRAQRHASRCVVALLCGGLLGGCADDDASAESGAQPTGAADDTVDDGAETDDGGTATDTGTPGTQETEDGSSDGSGGPGDALQADEFLARLPGLWAAPVTSETSVGDFPVMNMDIRAVAPRTLFSRVDLDSSNNLRFAFGYEDHPEFGRILVYRNGGFFQSVLRDTRTRLVGLDGDTWQFCAIDGGCGYIDARFELTEAGTLDLDVEVLRSHHIHWAPTRVEDRSLPAGFPGEAAGTGQDPFAPMPTLNATLAWTNAADEGEEAWLLLFTEPCAVTAGDCNPARFFRATVLAGDTEVVIPFDQIHPGSYYALAVLDRNGNLANSLFPDSGDAVSLPNVAVEVAEDGTSTATVNVMIEL